ncbi:hypothetical protein [Sinorhizobium psoraleae]|uniref:Uncharacterized protein n=1 Tax=Sinorhizobium psoraleae TaxID=520838 RepID=A0ABT4KRC8_9HYPH|nr:hypothetical protein [Sinorhizobium psoraleae]MCZ4094335.1 hypothetical protein [Sinorhizobium psoraleae]
MFGATLSRWTMSYFAAALAFLLIGEAMMVLGYGYPAGAIEAPETLVLVHTIALGWLSLLMAGALLQFVPVLVGRPLCCGHLAFPALVLLVVGIAGLNIGFVGLAGSIDLPPIVLPAAAVLTIAGFACIGVAFTVTLWRARPLPLTARFVVVGLAALAVTILLGGTYAFVLGGAGASEAAIALTLEGVSPHAALGLGGWLTFTTMGVSYRLLTMFMLSPDAERRSSRIVWLSGSGALGLVAGMIPLVLTDFPGRLVCLLIAACLGVLAVVVYAGDMFRIYRERRRREIELNTRASIGAFGALIAAAVLLAGLLVTGRMEHGIGSLVYLVAFGWLTGMGLAQLYKIIPFMTWLECYGPALGRTPTPRVQDLVVERRALGWFRAFYASVLIATLSLSVGAVPLFRLASLCQLVAILALVLEFTWARRLSNVPASLRLPTGAVRPHLFLPSLQLWRLP